MLDRERQTRCDLAAGYRLVDLLGWPDLLRIHISARGSEPQDHFLLIPMGPTRHVSYFERRVGLLEFIKSPMRLLMKPASQASLLFIYSRAPFSRRFERLLRTAARFYGQVFDHLRFNHGNFLKSLFECVNSSINSLVREASSMVPQVSAKQLL
jgi:hypothetical protein